MTSAQRSTLGHLMACRLIHGGGFGTSAAAVPRPLSRVFWTQPGTSLLFIVVVYCDIIRPNPRNSLVDGTTYTGEKGRNEIGVHCRVKDKFFF